MGLGVGLGLGLGLRVAALLRLEPRVCVARLEVRGLRLAAHRRQLVPQLLHGDRLRRRDGLRLVRVVAQLASRRVGPALGVGSGLGLGLPLGVGVGVRGRSRGRGRGRLVLG